MDEQQAVAVTSVTVTVSNLVNWMFPQTGSTLHIHTLFTTYLERGRHK